MIPSGGNLIFIILTVIQLFCSQIDSVPLDFDDEGDDNTSLNPVILIPGLQGSQLKLLLQKDFTCHKASDYYFRVWLSQDYLLPYKIDCLLAMLELHPPSEQRVLAKTASFGDTFSIEDLDPYQFLDSYELKDSYFLELDLLVYETYLINDNRKSALVCHSLGCNIILAYLNDKPQVWKDKYIDRLITVAAPFGGSMKALKAIAVGDNMGIFVYDKSRFINTERSFPSLAYLLPNPKVFGDHVILKTPEHDYTANDFPEIFNFLNASQTYRNWNITKDIIPDIPFPGVRVDCI